MDNNKLTAQGHSRPVDTPAESVEGPDNPTTARERVKGQAEGRTGQGMPGGDRHRGCSQINAPPLGSHQSNIVDPPQNTPRSDTDELESGQVVSPKPRVNLSSDQLDRLCRRAKMPGGDRMALLKVWELMFELQESDIGTRVRPFPEV